MTIQIEPWLADYLQRIFARQGDATDIPRKEAPYRDGSEPQRSCCHANVDRWVADDPACQAVRGWVISAHMGDAIMLEAHSVVREADGTLVDITLKPTDQRAPFISHLGSEREFEAAREVVNQIIWLPS
ncbi:MAG TPA: hypothetical protein VFW19_17665 [Allosphingosinicella sp.]|nr:hypothetical protein [Allosphingosinicella sp.]